MKETYKPCHWVLNSSSELKKKDLNQDGEHTYMKPNLFEDTWDIQGTNQTRLDLRRVN